MRNIAGDLKNLNNPEVSIIVPIFNSEKTIQQSIESVINQTFNSWELICVDDGSTDNTESILREYIKVDSRIKYFYKKNSGVSAARNYGINIAVGRFIYFMDSDDTCSSDLLSEGMSHLKQDNSDIVVFGYESLVNGKQVKESIPNKKNENDILEELIYNNLASVIYNKIYSRKIIGDLKFTNTSIGEDYLFNLNLLKKYPKITMVEKTMYHYNLDTQGSLYKTFSADRGEVLRKQYEQIQETVHVYNISMHSKNRLLLTFRVRNLSGIIMNLFRLGSPYRPRDTKQILKKEFNYYKIGNFDIIKSKGISKFEKLKLVLAKNKLTGLLQLLYVLKRELKKV